MADIQALKAQFDENGFVHLRAWVDPMLCEKLIFRMRDLVSRSPESKSIFQANETHHTQDVFFLNSAKNISYFYDPKAFVHTTKNLQNPFYSLNKVGHSLHNLCPVYRKFSHQDRYYQLCRELGQKSPHLVQSMFIFKQSKFGDAVPAHQDGSFIYTEPNSVLGLWFALEDADKENGCLWVLPGGHRGKLKNRFAKTKQGIEFTEQNKVFWPKTSFQPMPAKKGDIIVLHGLLPHLSEQNTSHRTRFAYTLHFIDGKAYFPKSNWLDIY